MWSPAGQGSARGALATSVTAGDVTGLTPGCLQRQQPSGTRPHVGIVRTATLWRAGTPLNRAEGDHVQITDERLGAAIHDKPSWLNAKKTNDTTKNWAKDPTATPPKKIHKHQSAHEKAFNTCPSGRCTSNHSEIPLHTTGRALTRDRGRQQVLCDDVAKLKFSSPAGADVGWTEL